MTNAERATAYEAEAASLIDRTIRKLPEGIGTEASRKLVELIVQAATARAMEALRPLLDNAAMASSPIYLTDGKGTLIPVERRKLDDAVVGTPE